MELNDILAKYESEEIFEFYDLSSDLGKLSSEDNSLAVKAECLAMAFSEGGHNDWETFYGPTITWTVKSTGELVYSPDKKEITKQLKDLDTGKSISILEFLPAAAIKRFSPSISQTSVSAPASIKA